MFYNYHLRRNVYRDPTAIDFFTPVDYGASAQTIAQKAITNVDNYFNICGKKAVYIKTLDNGKEHVKLEDSKFTPLTILKTIGITLSYFTLIIPTIMYLLKCALREGRQYTLADSSVKEQITLHIPKNRLEKEELANDLEKLPDAIRKIQELYSIIQTHSAHPDIEYLDDEDSFRFNDNPHFIFKKGKESDIQVTFNMWRI